MKYQLIPQEISGAVAVPPSKSMAHRSLLAAGLATGTSRISNLTFSQDMEATLGALPLLGARVKRGGDYVVITGNNGKFPPVKQVVDCIESGSTLRFLLPLFTHSGSAVTFTGRGRLMARPQEVYAKLFQEKGLSFLQKGEEITVSGQFSGGTYSLDGSVSSQFITGLLFTLPLLEEDSIIEILPPFESRSYVLLTLQTLSDFGVHCQWTGENTLHISGKQSFQPKDYVVEGDCSQAAFWAVLGGITGRISLSGIRPDTLQGDRVIFDLLEKAAVKSKEDHGTYIYEKSELVGTEIDLADCPDLGPILMVLGLFAKGETKIYNAGRLRVKESDRIAAMESEIRKMGGKIRVEGDTIYLTQSPLSPSDDLISHNDHRIVMAMAVAAVGAGLTVSIDGAEAVEKSYPDFFAVLASCGVKVIPKI
ncbi:MAG: 3-phosphoshikimate 1-carboxyvinyltransferase [Eubacteriales bacterium]